MDEEESKAHFNLDDLLTDKKQKRNKKKRSNDEEEKKLPDDFKVLLFIYSIHSRTGCNFIYCLIRLICKILDSKPYLTITSST